MFVIEGDGLNKFILVIYIFDFWFGVIFISIRLLVVSSLLFLSSLLSIKLTILLFLYDL
jgi:hypothetical protein